MDLLTLGPVGAPTVVLAHSAGAGMESAWMTDMCERLAERDVRSVRFEFAYMAARREGIRRPPPRAETLIPEFRDAVAALAETGPLVIGGKSMGGRVASMLADELSATGQVGGLVCLGYPFHPPEKPAQLRTAHLVGLTTPTLICQGTRDPFGTSDEVPGYDLSPAIEVLWFEDGDHDLRPRKAVSGHTLAEHLTSCADAVAAFVRRTT